MDSGFYFGSLRDIDYAGIYCCMYSVQLDPARMCAWMGCLQMRRSDRKDAGSFDVESGKASGPMVSLAGIITNLLLCFISLVISALLCRIIYNSYILDYVRKTGLQNNLIDVYHMYLPSAVYSGEFQVVAGELNPGSEWALFVQRFFLMLATMNLGLAVFNLLPVPPLDGYRFLDMFVFKGKLMIDQRIAQIISLAFMVLLLSGVFDNLLSLVNGTVFGFFSSIAGTLV